VFRKWKHVFCKYLHRLWCVIFCIDCTKIMKWNKWRLICVEYHWPFGRKCYIKDNLYRNRIVFISYLLYLGLSEHNGEYSEGLEALCDLIFNYEIMHCKVLNYLLRLLDVKLKRYWTSTRFGNWLPLAWRKFGNSLDSLLDAMCSQFPTHYKTNCSLNVPRL